MKYLLLPPVLAAGFFAVVLFAAEGPDRAQRTGACDGCTGDFFAGLDATVTGRMRAYDIPGVNLAVLRRGKIVRMKAYGMADRSSGSPMALTSLFRVESLSKSVTAWGVMYWSERGRIDLDSPLVTDLRELPVPPGGNPAAAVTARQLLSHTAGLPLGDFSSRYDPAGSVPALRSTLMEAARPVRAPGTGFSYSNTGYDLLELLIEEVSGARFSDFMRREILLPLGMASATFDWSSDIRHRIPAAYDLQGERVPLYVHPGRGSGGMFATVEDMAHFLQAGMSREYRSAHGVLTGASIRRMYEPHAEPGGLMGWVAASYGLGFFLEPAGDGPQVVWNGGQGTGWMAHFHFVPETGDGIVLLANSQRAWPLFAHVLRTWSRWVGIPTVGMARLTTIILALQILMVLVLALAGFRLLWTGHALVTGRRVFVPLAEGQRLSRCLQGLAALSLLCLLLWERSRDYLFIWSVVPHLMGWLELAVLALALSFALAALTPRKEPGRR